LNNSFKFDYDINETNKYNEIYLNIIKEKNLKLLISNQFNIEITIEKIKCLDNRDETPDLSKWLNDDGIYFYIILVINFYVNLINDLPSNEKKKTHYFSTIFYAKLFENDIYKFEKVNRWTKNIVINFLIQLGFIFKRASFHSYPLWRKSLVFNYHKFY
jgi:Ulp1 family protease